MVGVWCDCLDTPTLDMFNGSGHLQTVSQFGGGKVERSEQVCNQNYSTVCSVQQTSQSTILHCCMLWLKGTCVPHAHV